jgi:hypothetical protein
MDSVKRLRDGLMTYEWQMHGKELAGRRWGGDMWRQARPCESALSTSVAAAA